MPATATRQEYGPDRERTFERVLNRLDRLHQRGTEASALFTQWRLIVFVAGILCSVIPYKLGWFHIGNAALATFIVIFSIVAAYHNRLEDRLHRARQWRDIKRTHLARLTLDWASLPPRDTTAPDTHPYAGDLDLIGPRSLLMVLDTTVSSNGHERLASWLLDQPPQPVQWAARQGLVRELARLSLLRDRLVLESRLIDPEEINGRRLQALVEQPFDYPGLTSLLVTEIILILATAGLLLASLLEWLPNYWILSYAAYVLTYLMVVGRKEEVFEHALSLHLHLEKLGALFGLLERRSFTNTPILGHLCGPLLSAERRPSVTLVRAAAILHRLSVKAHPLVHLALNALMPWDLFYTLRLQQLQDRIRQHLPTWFEVLADMEAASALGTFAYLHPTYPWPVPSRADNRNGHHASLFARDLGHPLIPASQRVGNDFHLDGTGRILLITGSNMSGKSTFLRTIGINLCLAQAGAPVCAKEFGWSWVRIACCIRVDDSLTAGLSWFYAEVKRLKQLLDATRNTPAAPVLFLIDEIFKGTNNRERLIGSRAFITELAGNNGFGLITTHDLELTELERQIPRLANAHFQETVAAGTLQFDYKLHPGPCPTTNALRIMALEGLPVPKVTE